MLIKPRFLLLPLGITVLLVTVVLAGLLEAQATSVDPLCSISPSAMPADKAAQLQQRCAREEADRQKPSAPRGYDPAVPTDIPQSSVGGPIYGISGTNAYSWSEDYVLSNAWWGTNVAVFAGALKSTTTQGIVIVTDRIIGQVPENPKTYLSPNQDGSLRITDANEQFLTLIATDGAIYQFDLTTDVLRPV